MVVVRPILCGLWLAAQHRQQHTTSPPSLVQGLAARLMPICLYACVNLSV